MGTLNKISGWVANGENLSGTSLRKGRFRSSWLTKKIKESWCIIIETFWRKISTVCNTKNFVKLKHLLTLALFSQTKAFFFQKMSSLIFQYVPDFTWKDINMICQLTSKFPIIFMTTGTKKKFLNLNRKIFSHLLGR